VPWKASDRTAGTGDALLMSWQRLCTSPTTRAGAQAISTGGWSKICSGVYSPGEVHVIVPTNGKLEVIYLPYDVDFQS